MGNIIELKSLQHVVLAFRGIGGALLVLGLRRLRRS